MGYCTVKQLKEGLHFLEGDWKLSPNYKGNIDIMPNDTDEIMAVIVLQDYEEPMASIEVMSGYEHLFEELGKYKDL
jgi:hypothetical protein